MHSFSRDMDTFKNTAEKLNTDVMEIRDDIRKRPTTEHVGTIIEERLRTVGIYPIHAEDHQKDMAYVRKARVRDDSVSVMKMWAMRTIVGLVIVSILTWTGNAVYNQIKEDVRTETIE